MEDKPERKRIFINNVDTYIGSNLGKYLHKCVIGATLDDEEEEEEADQEIEGFIVKKDLESCYEIHGTLSDKDSIKPPFIQSILKYDTREEFLEHVIEFDVILYDISDDINQIDEALWVANQLHEHFQWLEKEIIFILLSTVMTWAKTKPADPDDPEAALTEEDKKRRKSHPNFKDQFNAEKEILKLAKKHKSKIKMYIVAAGILYGAEEYLFHNFFKNAWNNSEYLYVYGAGTNVIPTIHVTDLAGVIQNIADAKPDSNYILAVDDSKNTLAEITRAISGTLSNGEIKNITKEQTLLDSLVEYHDLEILLMDLRIDASTIKEDMKIKWIAESGLVDNIETIVNEYRTTRNLTPLKACILGPPGSGKTFYCTKMVNDYQLKHLKIAEVISSYMTELEKTISYPSILEKNIEEEKAKLLEAGNEEEIDRMDELDEAKSKAEVATETKERFEHNMTENNGRLYDEDLVLIYKETLNQKACLNHGFILDGFPKTKEQANLLFAPDNEEEEENEKLPRYNPIITPTHLFLIEASDRFLIDRFSMINFKNVAEDEIKVEEFRNRLKAYRSINDELEKNEEDTVITYFDLRELHPTVLKLKEDFSKEDDFNRIETLKQIYYELGSPHIYPPNNKEMVLIKLRDEEQALRKMEVESDNNKIKEAEMLTIRKHNQNEWNENLELVKNEMHEHFQTQSLPLRNYLMHLVMPVLTEGLMDCAKVRTEDPIDFLSEFIIRYNCDATRKE